MSVVHVYLPDVRALPVTDVKALRAPDISAVYVYLSEGSLSMSFMQVLVLFMSTSMI
jgi:hypothetical protein